jgi:hypothetical protein
MSGRDSVLASINLDDELGLKANEIQNVIPEGMLPAEFETSHLPSAQRAPQAQLSVGHASAQYARKLPLQNVLVRLSLHRNPSLPQPSP